VHLAGAYAELAATERDVHAGRMPEWPFVLVGQQYLADPLRSVGNIHPVWAYAHVPNGYIGDATAAIVAQIERFAPGFRDRVIGQTVSTTTQLAAHNLNFVGGDIMTGAKDFRQLVFGPRITLLPYRIGVPGMYICSAATTPGPAHTVCAAHTPDKPHLETWALKGKPHNLGRDVDAVAPARPLSGIRPIRRVDTDHAAESGLVSSSRSASGRRQISAASSAGKPNMISTSRVTRSAVSASSRSGWSCSN
jgi:hypothetical protein